MSEEPNQGTAPADPNAALVAELVQLKAWRAQREVEDARQAEQARLDEQRRLAEKGQIDELVKRHAEAIDAERRRVSEVTERHKVSERSRELHAALSGHPLVKGAAEQLAKLWSEEFEVIEAGDRYQVRSKDLKSVRDWVAERLGSEEYAHFVRAEQRGGGGTMGGQSRQVSLPEAGRPVDLADEIAAMLRAQKEQAPGYHPGLGLRFSKSAG